MSGYLWFDGTGESAIDSILNALEQAGHAYHHTESWGEETSYAPDGLTGNSPRAWVQEAADRAATALAKARAQKDALVEALEMCREWVPAGCDAYLAQVDAALALARGKP